MKGLVILLNVAYLSRLISTQSDVRLPPTIRRNSNVISVMYLMHGNVTLECRAEGVPAVRYEWKKNDLTLNTNLPNIRKGSDGTITINRATDADEGYYQCFAQNQYGTALSDVTRIRMAYIDNSRGDPSITRKTVAEGEPFFLEGNPRRSFPEPTLGWITKSLTDEDNSLSLILETKRIQQAENGDLHYAYALLQDSDNDLYHISLSINPVLESLVWGSFVKLTVTRNPTRSITEFTPTLAFSSAVQTVGVIGGNVTLRCFFYGYPETTISWSGPLRAERYRLNSFKTELTIQSITVSDEGNYNCTGSNTQGNSTQTLQLRVGDKPKFRNPMNVPYDVNVTEGESVTFSCNAIAKPEANIVWLQNGHPIHNNSPPKRFEFSNDNTSLTIRNVCRDCVDRESKTDLMVIQCNASNVHGYAFAQGYLNVLSRTRVTIRGPQNVSVDFLKENEFMFQCDVTSDPSIPTTVQWYKTEPSDELVLNELPYVFVAKETLVIKTNPKCNCTKYLGKYRCVADNGFTRDDRTITLTYQPPTEPDIPKEETWAEWKIISVAGAIGICLLCIGIIFLYFRLKQGSSKVPRQGKSRRMPELPQIEKNAGSNSARFPFDEFEASIVGEGGVYDQIGYNAIDDKYESIETSERGVLGGVSSRADEGIICSDNGYLIPLGKIRNDGKVDQQEGHGYLEVVGGPDISLRHKSNYETGSMNIYSNLSRQTVSNKLDLDKENGNQEEVTPKSDPKVMDRNKGLSPVEVDQYMHPCLQEANPVSEYLDLGPKEVNQYMCPI